MQPAEANEQLVNRLIAEGALWTPSSMAAFRSTPRHCFIDRVFQFQFKTARWREVITREPGPAELRLVYADRALITRLSPRLPGEAETPISSSSQPSLMARMLEDLKVGAGQRILEIGAGTGYNAALLAHVAGSGQVLSIDVDRSVLAEAWEHLGKFPDRGVELKHADGRTGFAGAAPYDRIMVTAATGDLESAWLEQLAEGGLLLAPLALGPGLAFLVRGTVRAGLFYGRLTRAAYFMPLRAEHETGVDATGDNGLAGPLQTLPAPWADWFDRKHPRIPWQGFIQALIFYGMLRGLAIHYRGLGRNQALFGVSNREDHSVCWLGPREWHVNGQGGRELGERLWRAFLDAGGPWPTEFALTASPRGGLRAGPGESFLRQGPRCQQCWQLLEDRERQAWI
jgi:protein-L-isoaspartate(D-aspartate) O-methyltransferase